ncbi:MAG: polyphosphate kinase 1 [Bacteroidota bacterium]
MNHDIRFFDRDLSWLGFNYRVLMEARDKSIPVYERLKFLAIFSSNLDEFFSVRVATLRSLSRVKKKRKKELGFSPEEVLERIYETVGKQQEEFGKIFREEILPELASNGIHLLNEIPTDPGQRTYLFDYFEREILPYVQPVILMRGKMVHFLREKALYLAVKLQNKPKASEEEADKPKKRKTRYAIVQIPTHYFPRFTRLPGTEPGTHHVMFLDDVVKLNLHKIFPGFDILSCHSIKLTRDADLQIEDEFSGNLVDKIQKSLSKRQVGLPSRFLYDKSMPKDVVRYLRDTFELSKQDLFPGGQYHNFRDFFGFPNPLSPQLEAPSLPQLPHQELEQEVSMFDALKKRDYLLHFPYQSYDYVIRFLNEAATDPDVEEIHTTQYRVASNSAVVNALIRAAQYGKKVTVFVEIKARFDEAINLQSAQDMQQAGVKIHYSFPGLKVHAKIAMAIRREADGLQKYAFLSTGNFNEKTARLYADHGLLTANKAITDELTHVFGFLSDRNNQPPRFKQLMVAQFNLRDDLATLIDREIAHHKAGKPAYILIKMNNLEEKGMIDKLYEASQAGVKVELIVRGICCLRPGVPGLSENIRVTRLVDMFLEHARVFVFHNLGADEMYMGSADWMTRNLFRRVEVVFPLHDPALKAEVMEMLELQLADNEKAVTLTSDLENVRLPKGEPAIRMQEVAYRRIESGTLGKEIQVKQGEIEAVK